MRYFSFLSSLGREDIVFTWLPTIFWWSPSYRPRERLLYIDVNLEHIHRSYEKRSVCLKSTWIKLICFLVSEVSLYSFGTWSVVQEYKHIVQVSCNNVIHYPSDPKKQYFIKRIQICWRFVSIKSCWFICSFIFRRNKIYSDPLRKSRAILTGCRGVARSPVPSRRHHTEPLQPSL